MESVGAARRDRGAVGEWVEVEHVGWAPPARRRRCASTSRSGPACGWSGAARRCSPRTSACSRRSPPPRGPPTRARCLSGEAEEARTLADGRRAAHRAAGGGRPRPAHAAGRDQGRGLAACARPTSSGREEERGELLGTIEDSADRLDAVVGNLLDASRLQAGALSVQLAGRGARRGGRRAPCSALPRRRRAGRRRRGGGPAARCAPIRGLLQRVLVNVLDNALRHGGERRPGGDRAPRRAPRAPSSRSSTTDRGLGRRRARAAVRAVPAPRRPRARAASGSGCPSPAASSRRWAARWSPTDARAAA